MVGTPYALLAAFGFFVYRGFKKISQAEAARAFDQDGGQLADETGLLPEITPAPDPRP
jgi:hypothetical protein